MYQIAIDGPSGSGKSSVAQKLAKFLGITYLDTGAMYRAVTLYLLDSGITLEDGEAVEKSLSDITLIISKDQTVLNGIDVSEAIREPRIDQNVSLVSSYVPVRTAMVKMQQDIAAGTSVVLDGRDIGTVVLPYAKYKFYLTATPEIRAKRRIQDYLNKGLTVSYDDILADIIRRDHLDSTREASPLSVANEAIIIDTSDLTFDEVVERLILDIKEEPHGTSVD